jgi:hypothetical protein
MESEQETGGRSWREEVRMPEQNFSIGANAES